MVTTYQVVFESATKLQRLTGKRATLITFDAIAVPAKGKVELRIVFAPPTSCHWTKDAPSTWQVLPESNAPYHLVKDQQNKSLISQVVIHLLTEEGIHSCQIQVEAVLYFCEAESGVCHMQSVVLTFPLIQSNTAPDSVSKSFNYSPTL